MKLEEALCFGKMIFVMKPILKRPIQDIQKQLTNQFRKQFLKKEEEEIKRQQRQRQDVRRKNEIANEADGEHI